jgi:hypothetical protein
MKTKRGFNQKNKLLRGVLKMSDYINKLIKVELLNKFYYKGKVIEDSENFIVLIDLNSKEVRINKNSIMCLEVLN